MKKATCQKCGLPLAFVRREGKLWPVNPDGSDHWDDCRNKRYAEAKQGEHIDTPAREFYRAARGDFTVRHSTVKPITGSLYREVRCDCGVPPWETCKHSFTP